MRKKEDKDEKRIKEEVYFGRRRDGKEVRSRGLEEKEEMEK